jgi:hypothetical protein
MAPMIAPKISPTLRTGMGSTAGAKDGSLVADNGLVAAKRQKTAGGEIPRVSLNLDGVRHRANALRLATANAAVDKKGSEVIPSDDNDKQGDEATSTMPMKPHKGGQMTPVGKTSSAGRTAPGKVAKLRLGAASDEMWAVARAGMPTAMHLTMDDDDEDVDIATAIERDLAMATALGSDRIIGGPAPAGKTSSASKKAPGKAAKLRLGAASNKTRAVARAGMPTAMHLTRDDNNEDVDVATAIKRGLAMATALGNDRIIGGPALAGKTLSASKKAPGKAAKLRLGAASNKTRAVSRAGMPTARHLTRDNDDKDVDVATAIERGLAMAMALGKDRIIGGPALAGKTSSASQKAPGKAAKLRIGAVSNGTRVVARAGMPLGAHLMMDNNDKDVDVATASKRGLAMRTALGNDRIIGGRVGANDRPETREVAVAGMPIGVRRAGKPSRH